ncbi:phospholipase [Flavihumibacter sp. R14]|nr:phospholipase [Flavihumibacter soli]
MYTHSKDVVRSGVPLKDAKRALIMIHGRGATPESIISLEEHLYLIDTAILAPRAANNSWYPYSFMAPVEDNQPALDSALSVINGLVDDVVAQGIERKNIYFLGFSQGACLALEYVTRHADTYGGMIAFTGGLIGKELEQGNYKGDFNNTPVLITTGDPDPHVPLSRVEESVAILKKMNARVDLKVYRGRVHTIQIEELELANEQVLV